MASRSQDKSTQTSSTMWHNIPDSSSEMFVNPIKKSVTIMSANRQPTTFSSSWGRPLAHMSVNELLVLLGVPTGTKAFQWFEALSELNYRQLFFANIDNRWGYVTSQTRTDEDFNLLTKKFDTNLKNMQDFLADTHAKFEKADRMMKNSPKAAELIANSKRPELHSEMVLLSRQETGVYGNVFNSWKKTKNGTWNPPSSNVLVPATATTTTTTIISSRTTPTSTMVSSNHHKTSENNVPVFRSATPDPRKPYVISSGFHNVQGRVLDYQYASFPLSITTLKNIIEDVEKDGMPSVYVNFSFEDDGTKNPPKVSTVSIDAKRVVHVNDQDTLNLQLRSKSPPAERLTTATETQQDGAIADKSLEAGAMAPAADAGAPTTMRSSRRKRNAAKSSDEDHNEVQKKLYQ